MAGENEITTEASLPLGLLNVQVPLPSGKTYDHARNSGNGKLSGKIILGTTPRTASTVADREVIKAVTNGGKKIFKAV